eukprot:TRINITY_DN25075_c0_g1_i2.p1 TRINITY_DN25075_c0_g1~~TRINITY_DN25075_c0_g1_i2.p1  ORF type:complete len:656 (+),score=101.10 TRINITY_DN25075_c0_g1_i2:104-2071(+)
MAMDSRTAENEFGHFADTGLFLDVRETVAFKTRPPFSGCECHGAVFSEGSPYLDTQAPPEIDEPERSVAQPPADFSQLLQAIANEHARVESELLEHKTSGLCPCCSKLRLEASTGCSRNSSLGCCEEDMAVSMHAKLIPHSQPEQEEMRAVSQWNGQCDSMHDKLIPHSKPKQVRFQPRSSEIGGQNDEPVVEVDFQPGSSGFDRQVSDFEKVETMRTANDEPGVEVDNLHGMFIQMNKARCARKEQLTFWPAEEETLRISINAHDLDVDSKRCSYKRLLRDILGSACWELSICFVTVVDCVLLGVEAEHRLNPFASEAIVFGIATAFKLIYLVDLICRFLAFGLRYSFGNVYTRLDTFLLVCMILDQIVIVLQKSAYKDMVSALLMLRVLRLFRLARALRFMVQFRTAWLLVSGLRASLNTVLVAFCILFAHAYIFAVIGMEMIAPRRDAVLSKSDEVARESFGSFASAMITLLQVVTLDNVSEIYRPLILEGRSNSVFCAIYFVFFIMFVSIAFMNLITAIMVEGSSQKAAQDLEAKRVLASRKRQQLLVRLRTLCEGMDKDKDGTLRIEEIQDATHNMDTELKEILGLDSIAEVFNLVDTDCSESLSIDEFIGALMSASCGNVLENLLLTSINRRVLKLQAQLQDLRKILPH